MSAASVAAVAATCNFEGRSSVRAPAELRIHPALCELGWPDVEELNNAAQLTQQFMPEPIFISSSGIILAGFGLWQLAVMERRMEIYCIEYPLNDDESLQFILRHHQIRRGWNAFVRICLALRLEAYFQEKALDNMRVGGKHKGSAILPDAQRIDVREQIASVAGACPRYVSNVKRILKTAHPRVIPALRDGRMTINRAMGLIQLTKEKQIESLTRYCEDREINKVIRHAVTRPQGEEASCPDMSTLLGAIQRQEVRQPGSTVVRLGRLQRTVILVGRYLLTPSLAQSELKLL